MKEKKKTIGQELTKKNTRYGGVKVCRKSSWKVLKVVR